MERTLNLIFLSLSNVCMASGSLSLTEVLLQYIQLLLTESFRFLYWIVDSKSWEKLAKFPNFCPLKHTVTKGHVLLTGFPQKVFVYTKVCKLLHKVCVDKCITICGQQLDLLAPNTFHQYKFNFDTGQTITAQLGQSLLQPTTIDISQLALANPQQLQQVQWNLYMYS